MNCREIEELLYDYASKRLGGKDKEVVEAHLKTCDLCRDVLHTIEKTLPVLDYWSTQALPADYSERVLKEIFEKKTTFWQRFINALSPPIHIQIPIKGLAVVALVCSALISYKLFYLTPVYEVLPRVTPPMEQKKEAERYLPYTPKGLEKGTEPWIKDTTEALSDASPEVTPKEQLPEQVTSYKTNELAQKTESPGKETEERPSVAFLETPKPPVEIAQPSGEGLTQGSAQEKKTPVEEGKERLPFVVMAKPQPSTEIAQPSEKAPAHASTQEKESTPKETKKGFFGFLSGLFKPKEPKATPQATVMSGAGGPDMTSAPATPYSGPKLDYMASLETKGITACVSSPIVNIRSGAGPEYAVVVNASKGTELTILEESGAWYKVRTLDRKEGWVRKDLVTLSPKAGDSTSSPMNAKIAFADPVQANTAFALDLYTKLKTAEGNLFFSPYSISTALAMTYAGARGNTEREMAEVLHFAMNQGDLHSSFSKLQGHLNEVRKKGNIRLSIANALWAQKDYRFLRTFTDVVRKSYEAEAKNVDFRGETENVRKKINAWVEENTENKIVELLKPGTVSEDTRLILTNAIYFKGNWARQFKKSQTTEMPFKLNSAKSVMVPMMQMNKEMCKYAENTKLQILELPYKGNDLSMVILLPRDVDGIRSLENEFSTDTLNMWLNNLHQQEVEIYLPKFKIEYGMSLTDNLKEMGMVSAFNPGIADFSGMDGTKSLYISDVVHKAFVNVDEEGTEAAAATAVTVHLSAYVERHIPVFRADHPFIFLIRDNGTGSILFMGRISNPKAGNS
jgi:serpin B